VCECVCVCVCVCVGGNEALKLRLTDSGTFRMGCRKIFAVTVFGPKTLLCAFFRPFFPA